jgi:hypothetical protein
MKDKNDVFCSQVLTKLKAEKLEILKEVQEKRKF